ncbi:dynactin p62 [Trametes versicolor FP-101664 SS1]|uniref:dynactin p62 n=1 Tax=Trametes versicolor (strain FP-101664) TaxID=717944 RepID=UPI00046218DE|nr:dynactin p62 [Trametes versicolor FP-101664 SS1]EIW59395.1 dynactin p62 [Trametes versicolor FP-101664 SS1]
MAPKIEYYCPCLAESPHPPLPHLPSSSYSFHPLHNLFFCEECDAVRCNRCVLLEVSGYYCPNCLFEVPSASVRAEKNRCARNCFMCPNCRNTLTVVPSDPPDNGDSRMSPIVATALGEPPFFLYCNHCRWDSAEVGITFEKPTGLAAQLQKFEDSAPESLEFERLKEHFEPFLRASSSSALPSAAAAHHVHTNPITAAASSALARDIPGVGKYNPLARSRIGRDKNAHRHELPDYKSRVEIAGAAAVSGEADVEFLRHLETISEVASLEQRWTNSWVSSLRESDLKPLRIPLQSKKSKRCPSCRHILIKPEQKAQSVRFKIKLVAANYLPAIAVTLPHAQAALEMMKRSSTLGKSTSAAAAAEEQQAAGSLIAGHSYSFHLAFTNPLYDPIQIRLAKAVPQGEATDAEKARRSTFHIQLPSSAFPVAAFAEAWEYDDDEEDMFGLDDDGMEVAENTRGKKSKDGRGKTRSVGIVERRANVTVVSGEVLIPKEARGDVKFNMLVSYTYRSDDPEPGEDAEMGTPSRSHTTTKGPEMKNFSFYTVVDLGSIMFREEPRLSVDL